MKNKKEILKIIESMTLKEKIGQINQPHYGWTIWYKKDNQYFLTDEFKNFIKDFGGVGSIYGILRTDPWTKKDFENGFANGDQIKIINLVQNYILENTRLKIPALIAEECPHGHQSLFSESYPTNISIGSSFDLKNYGKVINEQRKLLESKGVNLALISGLDIPVDKRWGRTEECFSEDPLIASKFNSVMVENMQAEDKVGVTIKHFIAYGAAADGKNGLNANIGNRELEEIHMKPFYGALDKKVKSVMVAYNEIDGVPCIVNEWLLKDILRNKLNYQGMIMADGLAIDGLQQKWINNNHIVAASALKSGIDISLWDKTFLDLDSCLKQNLIKESDIDQAVFNVLKLKNELNLLDKNLFEEKKIFQEDQNINIAMAASGSVVLKNDKDILPLKTYNQKVLVVGDNIDDVYYQLGDYSSFQKDNFSTYQDGINQIANKLNWKVSYSNYDIKVNTQDYDLVIFFGGGNSKRDFTAQFESNGAIKSSKQKTMTSGEGVDLHNLDLPKEQINSFETIKAKKIITIINTGKPMVLTTIFSRSDAMVITWYPGNRAGDVISKILLGDLEPSGRLNHSFPRYTSINSLRYNDKNIGGYKYFDLPESETLFPFGYGLGYGLPFEIKAKDFAKNDNQVSIILELENPNSFNRTEPILLFKEVRDSIFTQRKEELVDFEKVELKAKEKKLIEFKVDLKTNWKFNLNDNNPNLTIKWYVKQNDKIVILK
ncbi:glycoside hydrolase family 3 protein [Spiroplasma alleghenense]|uniref:Beta-glucosidase n=1 Tax=Spiroplasma alleghenense TaxID=216931 RepID=A0A345Z4X8_9MOLU|nr:glycoside hydrolase family 3 N-terminal domain-containing protein [Spiroplasma alleghenense]AXK51657.1 beta-glucosidase [Spiroplasma alleghenense]